jgi:hypothetical protein
MAAAIAKVVMTAAAICTRPLFSSVWARLLAVSPSFCSQSGS